VSTHLVSVILRLCSTTGWKPRMRGYRSMGLRVPDVMMTDWNLPNTGLMARLESKQASCRQHQMVVFSPGTMVGATDGAACSAVCYLCCTKASATVHSIVKQLTTGSVRLASTS
jgi:hypothetical protein